VAACINHDHNAIRSCGGHGQRIDPTKTSCIMLYIKVTIQYVPFPIGDRYILLPIITIK
jgi:hypothetical protein